MICKTPLQYAKPCDDKTQNSMNNKITLQKSDGLPREKTDFHPLTSFSLSL